MNLTLSGPFDTAQLPRIASEPVTLTVSRTVQPGWESEFLRWADLTVDAVRNFPGSLGAGVLHPGPSGGDYQVVFRFIDGVHLREWERSPQRAELMARSDAFVHGSRVSRTVGVESWFDLAQRAEPKRALWRRIFTDVAWVYPVALTSALLVGPVMAPLPVGVRTLLGALVITVAMRLAVGPMRSRLRARRQM